MRKRASSTECMGRRRSVPVTDWCFPSGPLGLPLLRPLVSHCEILTRAWSHVGTSDKLHWAAWGPPRWTNRAHAVQAVFIGTSILSAKDRAQVWGRRVMETCSLTTNISSHYTSSEVWSNRRVRVKEGFMEEVTKGQVHKKKRDVNKSIRGKIFSRQKEKHEQGIQTWKVKAFWGAAVSLCAAIRGCLDQGRGKVEPGCENPVCVSVTLLCLILCDPIDCSPPGSSVHGIFQARTLE